MPFIGRFGRPGLIGLAARTAVVAGTATAVTGGIMRHQQRKAQSQYEQDQYEAAQQQARMDAATQTEVTRGAAPAPVQSAGAGADMVAELQKLAALREQGALSEAEFETAKAKLLA
ncbi:hypothetical protein GCM10028798_13310 [Humibacter antri]